MSTVLVVIDFQQKLCTRYVDMVATDIAEIQGALTPKKIEQFRLFPDTLEPVEKTA